MIRDTSATDRAVQARTPRRSWLAFGAVFGLLVGVALAVSVAPRWLGSVDGARLRIAEVSLGTLVRDVAVQGSVVPAKSPTLYAPAAGTVTFLVKAGDTVTGGQILAEVSSPELKNQLDRETAALHGLEVDVRRARIQNEQAQLATRWTADQAEVDLSTARREWDRAEVAFERNAISQVDYAFARDNLRKAQLAGEHALVNSRLQSESLVLELRARELELERQQLAVGELRRQYEALAVRSPVVGQVANLAVVEKASVALNAALLTVVDLSSMELEIQVPESFAHELAPGMAGEIRNGDVTLAGALVSVSPEVVNGQVTARVGFAEQPVGLRKNQRLSVRILIEQKPNVLLVERGPFLESEAGLFAYVVAGDVAVRRAIRTGATSLSAVEIESGLNAGERIVISGTELLAGAAEARIR
jgi:HlyD family secretion protein